MSALPYFLIRPVLFALDAETVHDITIAMLASTQRTPLRHVYRQSRIQDPVQLCGLTFPNRLGIVAW